jgi:hypothetical protein
MKLNFSSLCAVAALATAGCASVQDASVADYNQDGVIQDAEYRQHAIRQDVQQSNVTTERMKVRHGTQTVNDVSGTVRDVTSLLRSF